LRRPGGSSSGRLEQRLAESEIRVHRTGPHRAAPSPRRRDGCRATASSTGLDRRENARARRRKRTPRTRTVPPARWSAARRRDAAPGGRSAVHTIIGTAGEMRLHHGRRGLDPAPSRSCVKQGPDRPPLAKPDARERKRRALTASSRRTWKAIRLSLARGDRERRRTAKPGAGLCQPPPGTHSSDERGRGSWPPTVTASPFDDAGPPRNRCLHAAPAPSRGRGLESSCSVHGFHPVEVRVRGPGIPTILPLHFRGRPRSISPATGARPSPAPGSDMGGGGRGLGYRAGGKAAYGALLRLGGRCCPTCPPTARSGPERLGPSSGAHPGISAGTERRLRPRGRREALAAQARSGRRRALVPAFFIGHLASRSALRLMTRDQADGLRGSATRPKGIGRPSSENRGTGTQVPDMRAGSAISKWSRPRRGGWPVTRQISGPSPSNDGGMPSARRAAGRSWPRPAMPSGFGGPRPSRPW